MSEAKLYTCPECGGNYQQRRTMRIKRADGDHLEAQITCCWLCEEGLVTLDQILATAAEPIEYFQRIVDASKPSDPITEVDDIPF